MTDSQTEPERRNWGKILVFTVLAIVAAVAIVFGVMQLTGGDDSFTGEQAETTPPTISEPTAPEPTGDSEDENEGDDETVRNPNRPVVPEPMNGQDAIDAMSEEDLQFVANRNGKTVEELKELLLNNPSAYVTQDGSILYRDTR